MPGTSSPNDSWFSGEPVPSAFYPQDRPACPAPQNKGGFQDVIDRAQQAMAVCDREWRYVAINRQWKKEFGLEDRNLVGQKHGDLFPFLGEHWEPAVRSVLLGHPQECLRDQWVLPSNRPAWVRWHLEPWMTKRDHIGGFTITCQTLPPEPHNSLALTGKSLLCSAVSPFVRLDLQGRILEWNAAAQSWALRGPEAPAHPFFWDVFCPEFQRETVRLRFLNDVRESLNSNSFCFEPVWSHSILPAGEGFKATWVAHPFLDEQDRIAGVLLLGLALPSSPVREAPPSPAPIAGASLAQMVEFAPLALVLLDSEGRTVFANHEHASLLGLDLRSHSSVDDWLRSACPHQQDPHSLVQAWRQSVWQEETVRTFSLRSSDHRVRHIRFHPRRTSDGGLLMTLSDVTEFHQKLERLEDTEEHFRAWFRHAQAGLVLEDTSGKILHANAACAELTQRNPSQLRSQSFIDLVHPEDRPVVLSRMAEIRQDVNSRGPSLDVRLLRNPVAPASLLENRDAFVRLTLCGIPDAHGTLLHFAYFLADVAIERLKPALSHAEDSAAVSTLRRHALAFEQEEDAILITDAGGRILDWNPAATRLFGYSREAILGKSFSILFAPQQPQSFHLGVAASFAEAGQWVGSHKFYRKDGSEGMCQVRYVATSASPSQPAFIVGFHRLGVEPVSYRSPVRASSG